MNQITHEAKKIKLSVKSYFFYFYNVFLTIIIAIEMHFGIYINIKIINN